MEQRKCLVCGCLWKMALGRKLGDYVSTCPVCRPIVERLIADEREACAMAAEKYATGCGAVNATRFTAVAISKTIRERVTKLAMIMLLLVPLWFGAGSSVSCEPGQKPRIVRCRVTGYCPCATCCGKFSDGKTSIGDDAYILDGVAANPKRLPYRTRLKIPGVGIKEVDDTGGAMKRGKILRIDVRFGSHREALEFGIKYLDVEVLP